MPAITRRALLGSALAAPALLSRPAAAADFTLKIGMNAPATHPLAIHATQASGRIREATAGRVELQIYPSSQLGSDTDMLSQIRSGALEMMFMSGLILSTLVPLASINGIGFAFKNYDSVWPAMDGKLGAVIRADIARHGLVAMERVWDNGFRNVTNSIKPILSPADLARLKLRVPVSPLWTSMFQALGASPVSINLNEVYSALQTHVVDGQENPMALIQTSKFFEVQKYLSLTRHMWDGYWPLANRKALAALKPEDQDVVRREFDRAALEQRDEVMTLNASLGEALGKAGMAINEVDPAPFREKLKVSGFYKDWRAKYGDEAWSVLADASGGGLP